MTEQSTGRTASSASAGLTARVLVGLGVWVVVLLPAFTDAAAQTFESRYPAVSSLAGRRLPQVRKAANVADATIRNWVERQTEEALDAIARCDRQRYIDIVDAMVSQSQVVGKSNADYIRMGVHQIVYDTGTVFEHCEQEQINRAQFNIAASALFPSVKATPAGAQTTEDLKSDFPVTKQGHIDLTGSSLHLDYESSIATQLLGPFAPRLTPSGGPPLTPPVFVKIRGDIGRATGSESGTVPTGGPNLSAFTLIKESPLFGSGVGLGTDGQKATVSTKLRQADGDASVFIPLVKQSPVPPPVHVFPLSFGVGVDVSYQNREDKANQWDLTFGRDLVNMSTTFKVEDVFVAPRFALRAETAIPGDNGAGPLMLSGEVFISPGVVIGSGSAKQKIHIGTFDDRLTLDDDQTKFAYRTGVVGKAGIPLARSVVAGVEGEFDYQSASSYWTNPVLATEQPAHLNTAYSTAGYVGGYLTITFGPAAAIN